MTRRAALLTSLLLLATACSGDDSSPSTTASSADTSAPADTAVPGTDATTSTAGPTTTTAPAPEYAATIDELLAIGRPIVLAHTAGEDEFPASTLFGFGESVKAGVDMLDLNVSLTKDGELLVQHDDTVDRNTNGTGAVADLTAAEIHELDAAHWFAASCSACHDLPDTEYLYRGIRTGERPAPEGYTADDFALPTLRQLVERFPTIPLNIEIKGEGQPARAAADELAAELEELGRAQAAVVASFDDEIVDYFHSIAPDVEVSAGLGLLTEWVLNRTPLPEHMRILQLPPEYSGLKVITAELVAASDAAGYPIWVWPNDRDLENQAAYRDFLALGVAGLNINFPAQGVAAVEEYLQATSVAALASSGCDSGSAEVAAGETTIPFTGAGQDGTYVRRVPPAYDGSTPLPVVLDLHGWSEPPEVHVQFSGLGGFGDTVGFVTITPDITRPVPRWDTALDGADMKWVSALLDELELTLCIDTNRVYVTGMSNGAMMTSAIACSLADRVAAVAPVAGVQAPAGCTPSRAVPLLAFHGTDDQYLSYEGGLGPAVADLPSPDGNGTLGDAGVDLGADAPRVPDVVGTWATANGCEDTDANEWTVAEDVAVARWDCPLAGETALYTVFGGGHTWPGSPFGDAIVDLVGVTTQSISANALMWQFFVLHPLGAERPST